MDKVILNGNCHGSTRMIPDREFLDHLSVVQNEFQDNFKVDSKYLEKNRQMFDNPWNNVKLDSIKFVSVDVVLDK